MERPSLAAKRPIEPASGPRPTERLESVVAPKQARSERTLQRILDSAEQLIRDKGLADVSVPDIVAHAGSSVGGFYARFHDKNELLRAIEERFFNRMRDRVEGLAEPSRWGALSLPEIARVLIHELVQTGNRERPLIEAILYRAAHDPGIRDDGLRFRRRVSSRIGSVLVRHADAIRHPEPAVAIDLGIQAAFAVMLQHIVFGATMAGGRALSDARLEIELTRVFLGYLGVSADIDESGDVPSPA